MSKEWPQLKIIVVFTTKDGFVAKFAQIWKGGGGLWGLIEDRANELFAKSKKKNMCTVTQLRNRNI